MTGSEEERARKPGPLRAAKVVWWAFLGIRRAQDQESDLAHLRPAQIIMAGIFGAALLVTALVLLVRYITKGF